MQKDERLKNHAPQLGASNQQLAIITQLLKGAPTLHHIDELLLWLAHSITERFDVQVSEFWTTQVVATDQPAKTELRAIASQDASLPRHVVWNSQVAAQAERTLQEQRHSTSAAVTSVFSAHQASLLNRYGLNYCCGYFLSTSSASTASCLLFTRSALPPPESADVHCPDPRPSYGNRQESWLIPSYSIASTSKPSSATTKPTRTYCPSQPEC